MKIWLFADLRDSRALGIFTYVHGDGKIGVLVELSAEKQSEAAKTFANDICLHVAAMNPISLSMEEVPAILWLKKRKF